MAESFPIPQQNGDLRKVHLEITTECDLDCKMCIRHAWQDQCASMSQGTFDTLLSQIRRIPTVQTVQFGGFGEPTTHPRLVEFLRAVKDAGLRAELISNGIGLRAELLERLIDLELDQLIVSLDQVSGSGDCVLHTRSALVRENLRNLHQMKFRRNPDKPGLTIEFVATKANIEELPHVKRLALRLGFDRIVVTNLIPHTADLCDQVLYQHWTTSQGNVAPSRWSPAVDLPRLDAWSKAFGVIQQLQPTGSNLRVLGVGLGGNGLHCRFVTEGRAVVDPDGNVSPCLALLHNYRYFFRGQERRVRAYWVGNVNQSGLADLWNDTRYRRFRDRVWRWDFSPCIDCGGCELRESNETDCYGNEFPCCGECLWAAGIVQCP